MNEESSVILKLLTDTIMDVAAELRDQYIPTGSELAQDQMRQEGNFNEHGGELSDEDFAEALAGN